MSKENAWARASIIAGLTAASLFGLFVLRALKAREEEEIEELSQAAKESAEKVRETYVPKFINGVPPVLPKKVEVVDSYIDETQGSPFDVYDEENVTDEAMEDYDPNVERFSVGDEDGQVSKHSPEYQTIINTAYGRSMNNPEYALELVGKTFGLGARGETFETSEGVKGRRFNAEEIEKLRAKLLEETTKPSSPTADDE